MSDFDYGKYEYKAETLFGAFEDTDGGSAAERAAVLALVEHLVTYPELGIVLMEAAPLDEPFDGGQQAAAQRCADDGGRWVNTGTTTEMRPMTMFVNGKVTIIVLPHEVATTARCPS